jgi:hypothetical protein
MSRSRVGLALSGAAILFVCGGVAAAAAGTPPEVGSTSEQPAVSVAPTPPSSASPSDVDDTEDTDDTGVEAADEDGPDADQDADEPGTGGVGPDATGPAHHGLCTAWSHVQGTPGKAADSTAFRNVALVDCSDVTTVQEPGEADDDATEDDADAVRPTESGTGSGAAKAKHPASTGKGDGASKGSTTKASKTKGSKGRSAAPGRH